MQRIVPIHALALHQMLQATGYLGRLMHGHLFLQGQMKRHVQIGIHTVIHFKIPIEKVFHIVEEMMIFRMQRDDARDAHLQRIKRQVRLCLLPGIPEHLSVGAQLGPVRALIPGRVFVQCCLHVSIRRG